MTERELNDRHASLRPMTATEFTPWRERAVESYAADIARATDRPLDAARPRAAAQFDELLPDGLDTDGVWLLAVEDHDANQVVGTL